ncbi:MAG: hypothetical protein WA240_03240 [Nitrospirota bacterium]|jgi:hypothetical protein
MLSKNRKKLKNSNKVASSLLPLVKEGLAVWKGGKPAGSRRPVKIKGKSVSEIVLEDRR